MKIYIWRQHFPHMSHKDLLQMMADNLPQAFENAAKLSLTEY